MSLLDRIPIRAALAGVYAIALAAAYAIFAIAFYFYLGHTLRSALDLELIAEVQWVDSYLSRNDLDTDDGGPAWAELERHFVTADRHYNVGIFTKDGRPLFGLGQRLSGQNPTISPADRIVISRLAIDEDKQLRVATQSSEQYRFHVAVPERPMIELRRHTLRLLLWLAPASLLGALVGGWIMAGAGLRPLERLTRQASRISASNLDERIPPRRSRDELGRLVEAFNRMVERLHDAFEQSRQFSSNVAHELRTPLTIMRGESELALTRDLTTDEARHLVSEFHEETIRMGRIVDDMLTLAQADRGQAPLDLEELDIGLMLREIHEDASILATEKQLEVRLGRTDPARVRGDRRRLMQMLRALTSNAMRYTPDRGTIRFESVDAGDHVEIVVEDTGIGISAEHLPRIFDRFYRVSSERSREMGGVGLGLALAKWIVEAHGGGIQVTSQPGKGSRFVVKLPKGSGK